MSTAPLAYGSGDASIEAEYPLTSLPAAAADRGNTFSALGMLPNDNAGGIEFISDFGDLSAAGQISLDVHKDLLCEKSHAVSDRYTLSEGQDSDESVYLLSGRDTGITYGRLAIYRVAGTTGRIIIRLQQSDGVTINDIQDDTLEYLLLTQSYGDYIRLTLAWDSDPIDIGGTTYASGSYRLYADGCPLKIYNHTGNPTDGSGTQYANDLFNDQIAVPRHANALTQDLMEYLNIGSNYQGGNPWNDGVVTGTGYIRNMTLSNETVTPANVSDHFTKLSFIGDSYAEIAYDEIGALRNIGTGSLAYQIRKSFYENGYQLITYNGGYSGQTISAAGTGAGPITDADIDTSLSVNPEIVWFSAGVNDVGQELALAGIQTRITEILDRILAHSSVRFVIVNNVPTMRSDAANFNSASQQALRDNINTALKAYCDTTHRAVYVDMYKALGGETGSDLYFEGTAYTAGIWEDIEIHPHVAGWAVYATQADIYNRAVEWIANTPRDKNPADRA